MRCARYEIQDRRGEKSDVRKRYGICMIIGRYIRETR